MQDVHYTHLTLFYTLRVVSKSGDTFVVMKHVPQLQHKAASCHLICSLRKKLIFLLSSSINAQQTTFTAKESSQSQELTGSSLKQQNPALDLQGFHFHFFNSKSLSFTFKMKKVPYSILLKKVKWDFKRIKGGTKLLVSRSRMQGLTGALFRGSWCFIGKCICEYQSHTHTTLNIRVECVYLPLMLYSQ